MTNERRVLPGQRARMTRCDDSIVGCATTVTDPEAVNPIGDFLVSRSHLRRVALVREPWTGNHAVVGGAVGHNTAPASPLPSPSRTDDLDQVVRRPLPRQIGAAYVCRISRGAIRSV